MPNGRRLAEFMPLRKAEEELREACRMGHVAKIGDGTRPETAPADDDDRIRAAVLRVFCLGLDADAPMHEHGIRLVGAWIDNNLDLDGCDLPRPIWVGNSVVDGNVVLRDASARQLNFGGSRCKAISADRLRCTGGIFLRMGFVATGTVRLCGATIGGNLDCSKGAFEANNDAAFVFDGANIAGDAFLNLGFVAKREVRLLGATIGGDLSCQNGHFEASEGAALSFDRAKIAGSTFLNDGFVAKGSVRLVSATIGSTLGCRNGTFEGQNSLNLEKAEIIG